MRVLDALYGGSRVFLDGRQFAAFSSFTENPLPAQEDLPLSSPSCPGVRTPDDVPRCPGL